MKSYLQYIKEAKSNMDINLELLLNEDLINILKSEVLKDNEISIDITNNLKTTSKKNFINIGEDEHIITYLSIDKIKDIYKEFILPEIGDKVVVIKKEKGKNLKEHAHEYLLSKKVFDIKNISRNSKGSILVDIGYISIDTNEPYMYLFNRFSIVNKKNNEITDEKIKQIPKEKYIELWNNELRQVMNIGTFIKEIFKNKYTDAQYEVFTKLYKTQYNNLYEYFNLVSGKDIAHWYDNNKYSYNARGTSYNLHGSCMGGVSKNYFDIYTKNPDKVKLLILKDRKDKNKIVGRALVWYLDEPENTIFMDTVYANDENLFQLFIKYAQKNNWLYKNKQSCHVSSVMIDGKEKLIHMSITLNNVEYNRFPYLDTLYYYDSYDKILSSYEMDNSDKILRNQDGVAEDI